MIYMISLFSNIVIKHTDNYKTICIGNILKEPFWLVTYFGNYSRGRDDVQYSTMTCHRDANCFTFLGASNFWALPWAIFDAVRQLEILFYLFGVFNAQNITRNRHFPSLFPMSKFNMNSPLLFERILLFSPKTHRNWTNPPVWLLVNLMHPWTRHN